MAKPRQPKRGRPRAEIDFMRVEELASVGLSAEQIAAELNVHQRTIERNFAAVLKKGRHKRNSRLQLKLYREAMNGNTAIAIFLAKNWLGMTDRPEVSVNVQAIAQAGAHTGPLLDAKAKRQLEELAVAIQKRARSRAMRELGQTKKNRTTGSTMEIAPENELAISILAKALSNTPEVILNHLIARMWRYPSTGEGSSF